MTDVDYDVIIVGASLGGVAAALSAGAAGVSVCLIDPTTWVGGQLTAQGVCRPDDTAAVNVVSGTRRYRDFRNRCREHYQNNYKLSSTGKSQPVFNAGAPYEPNQMNFAVEPKAADAILKDLLSKAPTVHPRPRTMVTDVEVNGDSIVSLTAKGPDDEGTRFTAKYFLDATDLGDLLPFVLRADEYVIGAEARADTQEPGSLEIPAEPRPNWIQPITFCIALEHRSSGTYTITKPEGYDDLKRTQAYSLKDSLGAPLPMPMFSKSTWPESMWNYRRYVDVRNFADPAFPYDLSMINTRSNDYQAASIPSGSAAKDMEIITQAKQAALGYLYWLQTECPRDGEPGKIGYPELRPNQDAFGTTDGIAPVPYIRESRRILALKRIAAQDIMTKSGGGPRATPFLDSCGIGWYPYMDVHALLGENPPMQQSGAPIYPFQIPIGALIPRRVTNLLAACKNIGTTHFTSGVYRLHPIEWNVGEAAGALAAFCVKTNVRPSDVPADQHLLRAYQRSLLTGGVPLCWWTDVIDGDPIYEASQMVGATQVMMGDGNKEMRFNPGEMISDADRDAIQAKVGRSLPAEPLSRGQTALWLFNEGVV
jgi:FAD-dependent oxidoreductase family protein